MPGAKGNRTKGNVKPSSSSRAAELLTQSGAAATGFIGFGTAAFVPASQAFEDEDSVLDSDFRVVLRKLMKKDATTKMKALAEFSTLCKEKDDATLLAILPFWPRLFNRLALDVDAKVRELTQNAMAILVSRVRRNLAPYLKNVMGSWILSQNDTYPTVASAANRSFKAAFPPEKQENAIIFCKQSVMEYMIDNLLHQTATTLSDPKTTEKDEMEEKFVRVRSSSLLGLRQLLLALPKGQIDDNLTGQLRCLLNEGAFWNLAKASHLLIRGGLFWFLGSLCQMAPELATEYVKKLSDLFFSNIDVSEPSLTPAVWDAVLSLVKFLPTCWENVNMQKQFWPKMKKLLESGCQGNAASVAPNILPLLTCIPLEKAGGAATFLPRMLESFKQGFSNDSVVNSVSEASALAKAFVECVQFSIKQLGTDDSSQSALNTILLQHLVPLIEASLSDPKPTLSRSQLHSAVSAFLRMLDNSPEHSKLSAALWSELTSDVVSMYETVGTGSKQSLHPDRLVSFIKALLYPQNSDSVAVKSERVKFASETTTEKPATQPALSAETVQMSEEAKSFVKKVVAHSHKLYRQDKLCDHFKLFVDLANLYFPADMATYVLESLNSETSKAVASLSSELNEKLEGEKEQSCPHSRVISQVVLPLLAGNEGKGSSAAMTDHTITLLFACLPYLSQQSSTAIWDSVLQSTNNTSALDCLIERALEKRQIMPQVSTWLSSPHLHSRLCDIITHVTTKHSTMDSVDLEQGWRILCLVLSANDNNEPVFPANWVVDVVSSVHKELITLASRTLDVKDVQVAIQFVARASLTFFQNLKMSVCLNEGRDMVVALMMADLDVSFPDSGEASKILRQSWTTGLGLSVANTGGLMKEGSMLTSACAIIKSALLKSTHTLEQYHRVIDVTEELLKTTQNHLPTGNSDDSSETYNPVLVALLTELVTYLSFPAGPTRMVVEHLILNGTLPLTELEGVCMAELASADDLPDISQIVCSSLFNLRLLAILRSGFRLEEEDSVDEVEEREGWGEQRKEVVLYAVKSHLLASTLLKGQSQVSADLALAVEDLTKAMNSCLLSTASNILLNIMRRALTRMKQDALSTATMVHLAQSLLTQAKINKASLQRVCSEHVDSMESCDEVLVQYLPQHKLSDLFCLHAAIFQSITEDSLQDASFSLRIMALCLSLGSEELVGESTTQMIHTVFTRMAREDNMSSLFLFSCDISKEPLWKVTFNMAAMQFLSVTISCHNYSLQSDFWDFVLCSTVSLVESLGNSGMSLASYTRVQAFSMAACNLLLSVASTIQQCLPEKRESFPPNLESEWKEFFSGGIFTFLFPLFIRLVEESKGVKDRGAADLILRAVGCAMCQCPQEHLVTHSLPLNLQASDDVSPIPDYIQTLLNYLCPALMSPLAPAQITAFNLLNRIVPLLPSYHKDQDDSEGIATEKEITPRPPPSVLMKVIEDGATAMDVVLSPVPMESTAILLPGTEEYQFALGYLLACQLMLRLFHSTDSQGRAEYAAYLKKHSSVERLLSHLFRLMPLNPGPAPPASTSPTKPIGASDSPLRSNTFPESAGESWFDSSVVPLTTGNIGQPKDIQKLSCCLYTHCLKVIPVLVRQWWKDQDRKTATIVEKFTTKYVSPHRIRSEIQLVNKSGADIDDLTVKASSISRTVTATYTTEELKAEIEIVLPESYPLGEISVQAKRHAVVSLAKWERMLLHLNIFLQHQNGSIMEGLRMWKNNIDKRLEGVEECFICYAVIHVSSYQLPRVPCRTCKKKFHSECLYKWLNSSQNSTCPLCRSSF